MILDRAIIGKLFPVGLHDLGEVRPAGQLGQAVHIAFLGEELMGEQVAKEVHVHMLEASLLRPGVQDTVKGGVGQDALLRQPQRAHVRVGAECTATLDVSVQGLGGLGVQGTVPRFTALATLNVDGAAGQVHILQLEVRTLSMPHAGTEQDSQYGMIAQTNEGLIIAHRIKQGAHLLVRQDQHRGLLVVLRWLHTHHWGFILGGQDVIIQTPMEKGFQGCVPRQGGIHFSGFQELPHKALAVFLCDIGNPRGAVLGVSIRRQKAAKHRQVTQVCLDRLGPFVRRLHGQRPAVHEIVIEDRREELGNLLWHRFAHPLSAHIVTPITIWVKRIRHQTGNERRNSLGSRAFF